MGLHNLLLSIAKIYVLSFQLHEREEWDYSLHKLAMLQAVILQVELPVTYRLE